MSSSSAPATGLIFLKGSNEISGRATESLPPTDQSSDNNPPSPTSADEFAISGRSNPPDPKSNAYRADLADVALAGRVIASHYAEPIGKTLVASAPLRLAPSDDAEELSELEPDDPFSLLDDTLGWAWGYAGRDRIVGYVRAEALGA
jgi:Bacterial dipeptidyl-peptidase Sh3 domain